MKLDAQTILFFEKLIVDNYNLYQQIRKDHAELKPAAQLYAEADAIATKTLGTLAADKAKHP